MNGSANRNAEAIGCAESLQFPSWPHYAEDEVAAAATGINTTSTKLIAFAIGASVSGLAGAFYGSLVTIVSPDDFSFSVSIAVLSIIAMRRPHPLDDCPEAYLARRNA